MKLKNELPSIPSIVDPMLIAGTFTRTEIMAKVRELRPDFKDPSAAVSNGFRRQVAAGNHPALKESERRQGRAKGVRIGPSKATTDARIARIDRWAEDTSNEVAAGFKRLGEYLAAPRSRLVRVWP